MNSIGMTLWVQISFMGKEGLFHNANPFSANGFLTRFLISSLIFNSHSSHFVQEEHLTNRKLSKLGATIATGVAATDVYIPSDQALYVQEYGGLGKVGYTTLRLTLLPYGVVFPPYDVISNHKMEKIVPTQLVTIQKKSILSILIVLHTGGVQKQGRDNCWARIFLQGKS